MQCPPLVMCFWFCVSNIVVVVCECIKSELDSKSNKLEQFFFSRKKEIQLNDYMHQQLKKKTTCVQWTLCMFILCILIHFVFFCLKYIYYKHFRSVTNAYSQFTFFYFLNRAFNRHSVLIMSNFSFTRPFF